MVTRRSLGPMSVLLALPLLAAAEPTVIYDSGRTEPLAPYLTTLRPVEAPGYQGGEDTPVSDAGRLGAAALSNLLPIRSPELVPGTLSPDAVSDNTRSRLDRVNAPPFFLIGSDDFSLHWLQANRAELQRQGAVGMLIEAETEADLRRVDDVAQGLPITLGSASDIALALGIRHYPVLITGQGVRQ